MNKSEPRAEVLLNKLEADTGFTFAYRSRAVTNISIRIRNMHPRPLFQQTNNVFVKIYNKSHELMFQCSETSNEFNNFPKEQSSFKIFWTFCN